MRSAFRAEGYELSEDGDLRPLVLENLTGLELTAALEAYVRGAKRGATDAALVTGKGKDLLEAIAGHVLVERFGSYASSANFPTLLGLAFIAAGLATQQDRVQPGEPARKRYERAMFEAACAVNGLRNRTGTGHCRPWLPNLSDAEAKMATQTMGTVAEMLLNAHKGSP